MLSILQHTESIQHLGMLACTSKLLKTHIYSNTQLWINAGKKLCGEEYWPPIDRVIPLNSSYPRLEPNDLMYTVKLRVCPWITAPIRKEIGMLNSIRVLGMSYNFKSIQVLNHICKLTVTLRGSSSNGFLHAGHPSTVVVRTDAYGTTMRFDSIRRLQQHWQMPTLTEDEITLLDDLKRNQWRPSALYESTITTVRIVHDGLFCVFAPDVESEAAENTIMYFVSTKTRFVLHTHRYLKSI